MADEASVLRLVSWNTCKCVDAVVHLDGMAPAADVGLLQEVEADVIPAERLVSPNTSDDWKTDGWERRPWRTVITRRAGDDRVQPVSMARLGVADSDTLAISRRGTIAAAKVTVGAEPPINVVSVHSVWERPVPYYEHGIIYADGSAHRIIADVAGLLDTQAKHRVIVAGDFNVLYGYGEDGSAYWTGRYDVLFRSFEAMGLRFVGPRLPAGAARPVVSERPTDSETVPTFRRDRLVAETATRQLDFVFASASIADRVTTTALTEEWGPSDHCRVLIEIEL